MIFKEKPWYIPLVAALILFVFYLQELHRTAEVTLLDADTEEVASEVIEQAEERQIEFVVSELPDFASITNTLEKKITFFDYFYPIVVIENQRILAERETLQRAKLNSAEVKHLCQKYSKDCDDMTKAKKEQLLRRIDVIPPALVLAQAAKESGWGTSRFALQAHNYFGQWCYSKGCGLIPESRNEGATHEVRKFANPQQSVRAYLFNLNTGRAYSDLRAIRQEKRRKGKLFYGYPLASSLLYYSERREAYVEELQSFIRYNKLEQYDKEFWIDLGVAAKK